MKSPFTRFSVQVSLLIAGLFSASGPLGIRAFAATFTADALIDSTDRGYDGQDIVVQGCTLTLNGAHAFSSLQVLGGGVVTHAATTADQEYALRLTIANALVVDATSKIDVSGRGYVDDRSFGPMTFGNTNSGAATGRSGGSYGGLGAPASGGQGNPVYGDYRNPNELGSSGSGSVGNGGAGGGLLRIAAARGQIDGQILADGATAADNGDWGGGGGSGGAIRLDFGNLDGSGLISANGGSGRNWGAAGGGGRIALYYGTAGGFDVANKLTAHGGSSNAAVGTVYLKSNSGLGQLLVSSHDTAAGEWTPLGMLSDTAIQVDNLVIAGSHVVVAPVREMPIMAHTVTITNGAALTHQPTTPAQEYSLRLNITNSLLVDAVSRIDVSGCGYVDDSNLGPFTIGNTNSGAATGRSGGAYGGLGAPASGGAPNPVYGDYRNPNELGSSGAGTHGNGGAGGGIIRVTAATAQIDGEILANGGDAVDGGDWGGGGGSGGAVRLDLGSLSGSGVISANGGSGRNWGAAGGGGRIAVYYGTVTQFDFQNSVTAHSGSEGASGAVGTIYLKSKTGLGQLVIANHGTSTGSWTPLGMTSDSEFQVDNLALGGMGVWVAPLHQMAVQANSILITNGAVLAHLPTTTSAEHSLWLNITNNLLVDSASRIDVSGLGYVDGYTLGNTKNVGATGRSGGSYGGLGAGQAGAANAIYGDYRNPNELGSGGAGSNGNGGAGGGLAHITAAGAQIDGQILANGANAVDNGDWGGGGGSGGAIWLSVGSLKGAGQIAANGGVGRNWGLGGGGGRTAVYYNSVAGFDLQNNVTTHGGGQGQAAVGTVYLKGKGALAELLLSSHDATAGMWTPLGMLADTVFQVDNLVIAGTNVVAAPVHEMPISANAAWITNGAALTHQPTTPSQEYSLRLSITSNLVVDATSRIDTSGRGYVDDSILGALTWGNTPTGGATSRSGGSYGGLGAAATGGHPNAVYGDYRNPNEPGSSGSGEGIANGGAGGGLIRITAASAVIDGQILAHGAGAVDNGNWGGGGGSGGAIRLDLGTLDGSGLIAANGGAGRNWGGGGSGGRIAVYYGTVTRFDLPNNVTAHGGSQGPGAVGTVYLKANGALGQLLLTSHGTPAGTWTPLGMTNDRTYQVDNLVLSGAGMVAAPVHEMAIMANSISVLNGAVLTHQATTPSAEYSLRLTIAKDLLVDADSRIDVSGRGYVDSSNLGALTLGNTNFGAASSRSGGSYGGLGAPASGGKGGAVYGDFRDPDELGSSGSGAGVANGGAGGGLIRITAGSARIDGSILANGAYAVDNGDWGGGGGSGGGIRLDVGTLAGSGLVAANGGSGRNWGGGGGGGRIAVYYGQGTTFDVLDNITTHGGAAGPGAVGSVYLKPSNSLGTLMLTDHGTGGGVWTPLGVASNTFFTAENVVISGTNVVVAPEHEMPIQANAIWITNGAVLTHQPTTPSQVYSLQATVKSNVVVDAGSRIDVSGRGYPGGVTVSDSASGPATGRSGGSYGGLGGASSGKPNDLYGDYRNPNEVGSGGAGSCGNGGAGGGLIRITAGSLQIDGMVLAGGANAVDNCDWGGGGGSGGCILLNAAGMSGSGLVAANGGAGRNWGVAGGGGRVAIYTWNGLTLPATNITASASPGNNGAQDGSIYFSSAPLISFANLNPLLHGLATVSWYALGVAPESVKVQVQAAGAGTSVSVGVSADPLGTMAWNTRTVTDGTYVLRGQLLDLSGKLLSEDARAVLINNSVAWHGGRLTSNETWTATIVHVIDQNLIVPDGVTVTIAPGAVVKIARNVSIVVQPGGVFNALGGAGSTIIITSLLDDSVGGDTNLDGRQSVPRPGDWQIAVVGGQFNQNEFVDLRYSVATLGGTLASSLSLLGTQEYLVTNNVVIPSGVQLVINPGAIIKFAAGVGVTVESGGALQAQGTLSQPIVFTSILDDSAGGDSNGDEEATRPAPGDWVGINLAGGRGSLNHCTVRYGGNTGSGAFASGVLIVNAGSLTLSNGVIEHTLYDGISVYGNGGSAGIANTLLRDLDRAIWAWGGGDVHLVNCTLDGNRAGLVQHGGASITAENCIVANSIQGSVTEGACALRYCDLWSSHGGSSNPDVVGQDGNISQDPKFRDPGQLDYRLDYGSPCIDAADGRVAPVNDATGAPRYSDPRTLAKTGVPTSQGQYADMGAFEFVETASSPLDLIGLDTEGPHQIIAGDTVVVSWTVANVGSAAVTGPWHDSIALTNLAGGPLLTAAELVTGQGLVLGPGEFHTSSALVVVPAGIDGQYRWQVRVNSRGEVFEGINWTNNVTLAGAPSTLTVPELRIGAAILTNQFGGVGESRCFRVVSTQDADVLIQLKQVVASGAIELYAGQGYVPTPQNYDIHQLDWNVANPALMLSAQAGATYYVLAYARSLPGGSAGFTVEASVPGFAVTGVDQPVVGSGGAVTLRVYGSQFQPGDVFEAVSSTGLVLPALSVNLVNSALAEATFDLGSASLGSWSVRVRHTGGLAALLPEAFQVEAGGAPNVSVKVVGRETIRAGRDNEYQVVYANSGKLDAYYAMILLTGVPNGATVTFGAGFQAVAQPQGVNSAVPLGLETDGGQVFVPIMVDRLRPGEGGSASFSINVPMGTPAFEITPLVFGGGSYPVSASYYIPTGSRPSKMSWLPCSVADEDAAAGSYLLGMAVDYYKYGRIGNWWWNEACVGEAAFMKSVYEPAASPSDSPMRGWTFTTVTKNGYGIGHTTVLAASPSGHYYIIDNYVCPTIIPVWHSGNGQWRISTDCLLAAGNPFLELDKLITAAGGGFAWTGQEPSTPSGGPASCPLPDRKPSKTVKPGNSSDPNLKEGPAGAQQYITGAEPMAYQIYFENQASATAPAQEVVVTDALSAKLDWATFELSRIGFNGVVVDVPPGLQSFAPEVSVSTDPYPVRVTANLNPISGVATWDITSIDPITGMLVEDPLAGFLPPDNAQGQGQGFVSYRIRPQSGLLTGAQILNQAAIVFDVNAPILTPIVTNIIDLTPPVSSMGALPATASGTNVLVSWSGSDGQSGVVAYSVYVADGTGPWRQWLWNVPTNGATFIGLPGHAYSFYSLASDAVGNLEAKAAQAEASTVIPGVGPANLPVLSGAFAAGGLFHVSLAWTGGATNVLQVSTNLVQWSDLATLVNTNGLLQFTDSNSKTAPSRYYRLKMTNP